MDFHHPVMVLLSQQSRERQRAATMAQALAASRKTQEEAKRENARYDQAWPQYHPAITGAGA